MADQRSPWLWGCGLGCAALLIVAIVLATGSFIFFRNTFSGFTEAVQVRDELDDQHGRAQDYTPPESGLIPADRVRAFLQVRRDSEEMRQSIAAFFKQIPDRDRAEELDNAPFWEKLTFGLSMARGGMGLGADMGHFFEARNRALLKEGMGLGEYSYIYCTIYYSWLQKPPGDGPGTSNSQVSVGGFGVGRIRRNWVAGLERAAAAAEGSAELTAALQEEITRLEEDGRRIPWQDGVPALMLAPLESFREELDESYVAVANPFELVINTRNGRFSYTSE